MSTTQLSNRAEEATQALVDPDEPAPRAGSSIQLSLRFDPTWLVQRLAASAFLLVSLHVLVHAVHYRLVPVASAIRGILDLDDEQSLGTWYSAFLLGMASIASFACARDRATGEREKRGWRLLGIGFLILSVDEIAGFHESFNSVTTFSWAIPGMVLLAVVGFCAIPFLRQLPGDTARRLILAGTIYGGGALGVELATVPMMHKRLLNTLSYCLSTAAEEGLEMAGIVLFLAATYSHLRRRQSPAIRFNLGI